MWQTLIWKNLWIDRQNEEDIQTLADVESQGVTGTNGIHLYFQWKINIQ